MKVKINSINSAPYHQAYYFDVGADQVSHLIKSSMNIDIDFLFKKGISINFNLSGRETGVSLIWESKVLSSSNAGATYVAPRKILSFCVYPPTESCVFKIQTGNSCSTYIFKKETTLEI